jgi:signal transduction histidine kinase
VLLNLRNNAKDAIEARGVEEGMIEIILEKENKTIRVVDNGGGIDDTVIKRIFEPYFTTKEQGKGVGMGLYVSKLMIEHMNGSLRARSSGGQSEFVIVFGGLGSE